MAGRIIAISCVAKDWGIGKVDKETGKGVLLFNLKADMENFKRVTLHNVVAMGENTLLSLPGGKPLKDRINMVLCQPGHSYEGCECYESFDDILAAIKNYAKERDVFIIGGGMFYKSMVPYYDYAFLTKVDAVDPEATVFFPNLDKEDSFVINRESEWYMEDPYLYKFVAYERAVKENELTM